MFANFLSLLYKKVLLPACGIFTLLVFFVALISSFGGDTKTPCILVSQALLLLLFSLVLAALNLIFESKLPLGAKIGIHFVSALAAMILILFLLSGYYGKFGMSHLLFMVFLFIVVYALVLGVWFAARAAKRKS